MLIDLKSLNKAEQNTKEPENQPVLFLSVPECRNLADSETSLRKQIGILEHNVCINFWSYGSFSLHELMFYILQQTGPAHINMCTWSISQDAIEKIIRKYQKGEILSIRFLLDPRVKVCKAKPLQMLSATFSHKILRVHAKVVTIENEVWKISVVSSQNATTNPKLERGVIFISDEIFNFDKTVFEHEFNTARTGNNRETGRTVLHPQTDCNNSGNRWKCSKHISAPKLEIHIEHITRAITKLISNSGKASHNLHYQVAHRHKQCSGIFKNKAEFQNNSYICKNINCLEQ